MNYDASDWYWRADDGRIFASQRSLIVDDSDGGYQAFAATNYPTPWPRDSAGNQTDPALQEVLEPYGIYCNDAYYAAAKRWEVENGGLTVTGIAAAPSGMPIKTDERSKILINTQANAAQADKAHATTWVAADGQHYPLTNAEIVAMGKQLAEHVDFCFETYIDVVDLLRAKKIAGRKQIDAAFATRSSKKPPAKK